jgi:plastocyanin
MVRVATTGKLIALASAMALLAMGCGDSSSSVSSEPPLVALSGQVSNHGTKDLQTAMSVSLELDDLYFSPTFIKATPGSTIEVSLKNDGKENHTFTIDATNTDVHLAPGQKSTVQISLPATGSLNFYCSIHRSSGMQGAFAVSAAATNSAPAATTATPSGGYGY